MKGDARIASIEINQYSRPNNQEDAIMLRAGREHEHKLSIPTICAEGLSDESGGGKVQIIPDERHSTCTDQQTE